MFGKWQNGVPASEITELVDKVKAKYLARGDRNSIDVKELDTLDKAFNQMMMFGEDIIPVLDDDGKVIGDLRLSEVLFKALEIGRSGQ